MRSAAVVTSCTAELAQARISAADIAAPNVVITVDQIARGKPDPEGFLLAAHRLGVEPGLCLVVEDAPSGLVAARAAGCATSALTTTTPRSELVADLIVNSLADVRSISLARGQAWWSVSPFGLDPDAGDVVAQPLRDSLGEIVSAGVDVEDGAVESRALAVRPVDAYRGAGRPEATAIAASAALRSSGAAKGESAAGASIPPGEKPPCA